MYGRSDEREGDARCVNCRAPIYFNAGPGGSKCPACGKSWEHTDEQLAEQKVEQAAAGRRADRNMRRKRAKIELLHRLKAGASSETVQLLDEIMNDVCHFEAEQVRTSGPPLWEVFGASP